MKRSMYNFLVEMRSANFGKHLWTRTELQDFCNSIGYSTIPHWIVNDSNRRASRGNYKIPEMSMSNDDFQNLANNLIGDGRGRPRKNKSAVSAVATA